MDNLKGQIVAIDDDRSVLHLIGRIFADTDVTVATASSAKEGIKLIEDTRPDAVLLDVMLPDMSGLEAFELVRQIDSQLPVVVITSGGTSDTAISAMKLGAFDYLLKPLDVAVVKDLARQALRMRRLMTSRVEMVDELGDDTLGDPFVGRSDVMQDVFKSIGRVAPQDVSILIRGESGTGKELVARAIFQHSQRSSGPFLAVNCAALSETLLESELFGHEKGSFTGAVSRRVGKFEQCSGGTIFLDEVGDMAQVVQGKVLRLLQEQEFERVGGNETIKTDVRVIAATNRDLEEMGTDGSFRTDLYYRLNGYTIHLPALRERGDDIPLLLNHFLKYWSKQLHKNVKGYAPEALEALANYSWPGNVRELQAVIKQSLLHATGPVIMAEFLPDEIRFGEDMPRPSTSAVKDAKKKELAKQADHAEASDDQASETSDSSHSADAADLASFLAKRLAEDTENLHGETIEFVERYLLQQVLSQTGGNQSQASRILGITRGSLRNKIRSLGIQIDQVVTSK